MTVIQDVIDHLNTNWGVLVVPKPSFHNGHRLVKDMELGTNYVNIYNESIDYEDYDSAGLYRNEIYSLLLQIGSVVSQAYIDIMVAEIETLLNTKVVTSYHYNRVMESVIMDSSEDYMTSMRLELKKLLQLKV